MSESSLFDKVTTRTLVLQAYRLNKISGCEAWRQFSQQNLWNDKNEEFHHYHNGLETFETQAELWRAPDEFRQAACELIRVASEQKTITPASEDWLRDLFGLSREADE